MHLNCGRDERWKKRSEMISLTQDNSCGFYQSTEHLPIFPGKPTITAQNTRFWYIPLPLTEVFPGISIRHHLTSLYNQPAHEMQALNITQSHTRGLAAPRGSKTLSVPHIPPLTWNQAHRVWQLPQSVIGLLQSVIDEIGIHFIIINNCLKEFALRIEIVGSWLGACLSWCQSFGVSREHGGLPNVAEAEIQHADSLQPWKTHTLHFRSDAGRAVETHQSLHLHGDTFRSGKNQCKTLSSPDLWRYLTACGCLWVFLRKRQENQYNQHPTCLNHATQYVIHNNASCQCCMSKSGHLPTQRNCYKLSGQWSRLLLIQYLPQDI